MPQRSSSTCLLVSGGLDSGLLLHRYLSQGIKVLPVYLRCGLCWEAGELHWLHKFLRAVRTPRLSPLCTVDLPLGGVYANHWSLTGRRVPGPRSVDAAVYLPGRNVLLVTAAAIVSAKHRISTIALGVLKGNPFGDASPRFCTNLAAALSQALNRPMRIVMPLRRLSKAEAIRAAQDSPLELTFSCLQPRGMRHCGRCNKCAERRRAFRAAGMSDPTRYVR